MSNIVLYLVSSISIVTGLIFFFKPKPVTKLYNDWYKLFKIPIKLPEKYTQVFGMILIVLGLLLPRIVDYIYYP